MKVIFKQRLIWLKQTLDQRISMAKGERNEGTPEFIMPRPADEEDAFADLVQLLRLTEEEQLVLLLGLSIHLNPEFLNEYMQKSFTKPGSVPYLGLSFHRSFYSGFLPTGETVLFLLGANNPVERQNYSKIFGQSHKFAKYNILRLENPPWGEPIMLGRLVVNPSLAKRLLSGHKREHSLDQALVTWGMATQLNESDLVMSEKTLHQIQEIKKMIRAGDYNPFANTGSLSFSLLFHGPNGTGKSLAAMMLAKSAGLEIYRIDLSQVVSKYIGETEKNLSKLLEKAQGKPSILYFDEADALFGKRTSVRDSHDKYANQEVSYLLQRIESHDGIIILSTADIENFDQAIIRRFHHVVSFAQATAAERYKLWKQSLPSPELMATPTDVELQSIAGLFHLSANEITMLSEKICLSSLKNNNKKIAADELIALIKKYSSKQSSSKLKL